MKNKLTKVTVISLVVVLVMSLGVAAVFAQDDTTPDTDTPTQPALPFGRGGFGGPRGHHDFGGADDEALAAQLGITVEELQAAREQVQAQRLAQAVEDGYLTQEQVDAMLAAQAVKQAIDKDAIMADALGLTADELAAAREDGSLRDILANITPAELQASMQQATEAALAAAVAAGDITQEQADLYLSQSAGDLGMRGLFGGHHGFDGGRGGFRGFEGAPDDAPTAEQSGVSFTPFDA